MSQALFCMWVMIHQEISTLNRMGGHRILTLNLFFSFWKDKKQDLRIQIWKKKLTYIIWAQMGNCCIRQSSWLLHLMLNFLKTILFSWLLGMGEKIGYVTFTFFFFFLFLRLNWVDLDDPQLPNLFEDPGHLQFSLSKPVPHTLSSALCTWSMKSPFSRRQVSWFSLVGGLHPSPDFGTA